MSLHLALKFPVLNSEFFIANREKTINAHKSFVKFQRTSSTRRQWWRSAQVRLNARVAYLDLLNIKAMFSTSDILTRVFLLITLPRSSSTVLSSSLKFANRFVYVSWLTAFLSFSSLGRRYSREIFFQPYHFLFVEIFLAAQSNLLRVPSRPNCVSSR